MIGAILLQIVLIGLNAIFASAEIAVISMNDMKLQHLADGGNRRARKLIGLTAQPARFLATIQVAITLAGFLGSAYAADNFAGPLVQILTSAGVQLPAGAMNSICVFVITVVIAYFSIVFGELIPKRIAMHKTEAIALGVAGPLSMVSIVFKPLVWLLTASTNGVLKLLGISPEEDETVTEEEIRMMVAVGSEKGVIDRDENEMIQNVLDFNDVSVEEICTHRKDVLLLEMEDDDTQWRATICNSRHNYIPVCGEDSDDIIGVLDTRAFLRLEKGNAAKREEVLAACLRKPWFVSENMKADSLCRNMKETGIHFAVAIDEYGGMSGVVTMHDLMELIVGEMFEEGEPPKAADIEEIAENCWRIQGVADIEDVAGALGLKLPIEEYDTFGGWLFGCLGRIPPDGEAIYMETEALHVKIEDIRDHRVVSTIVSKKEVQEEGA